MRFRTLSVAAALAAISATALAQGPRIDGNWEIKTTMEIPGMPRAMPPTTTTQCITKDMVADPKNTVPQGQMPGRGRGTSDNCKMTDYKMQGNTVTYTMKCDPPQQATINGSIVYGVDSYEGTMKMDADRGGQAMTINIKTSGKRLGDCTK